MLKRVLSVLLTATIVISNAITFQKKCYAESEYVTYSLYENGADRKLFCGDTLPDDYSDTQKYFGVYSNNGTEWVPKTIAAFKALVFENLKNADGNILNNNAVPFYVSTDKAENGIQIGGNDYTIDKTLTLNSSEYVSKLYLFAYVSHTDMSDITVTVKYADGTEEAKKMKLYGTLNSTGVTGPLDYGYVYTAERGTITETSDTRPQYYFADCGLEVDGGKSISQLVFNKTGDKYRGAAIFAVTGKKSTTDDIAKSLEKQISAAYESRQYPEFKKVLIQAENMLKNNGCIFSDDTMHKMAYLSKLCEYYESTYNPIEMLSTEKNGKVFVHNKETVASESLTGTNYMSSNKSSFNLSGRVLNGDAFENRKKSDGYIYSDNKNVPFSIDTENAVLIGAGNNNEITLTLETGKYSELIMLYEVVNMSYFSSSFVMKFCYEDDSEAVIEDAVSNLNSGDWSEPLTEDYLHFKNTEAVYPTWSAIRNEESGLITIPASENQRYIPISSIENPYPDKNLTSIKLNLNYNYGSLAVLGITGKIYNVVEPDTYAYKSTAVNISSYCNGMFLYSPTKDTVSDIDVYNDFLNSCEYMLNKDVITDKIGTDNKLRTQNSEYDFSNINNKKRAVYTSSCKNNTFTFYPEKDYYNELCFVAYSRNSNISEFPVVLKYTDGTEEELKVELKAGIGAYTSDENMLFNTGLVHNDVLWGSTGESETGKNEFGETIVYEPGDHANSDGHVYEYKITADSTKRIKSVSFGNKTNSAYILAVSLNQNENVLRICSEEIAKFNGDFESGKREEIVEDLLFIEKKLTQLSNDGYNLNKISGYDTYLNYKEQLSGINNVNLYVSVSADDTNDGRSAEKPINGLQRLSEILKEKKELMDNGIAVTVNFLSGDYYVQETFEIDESMTSDNASLTFKTNDNVRLHGSINFNQNDFTQAVDTRIKSDLSGKIYQAGLNDITIGEYTKYTAYPNFVVNGVKKPLAAYPNSGYAKPDGIIDEESLHQSNESYNIGYSFSYNHDINTYSYDARASDANAMLEGYTSSDYAYSIEKITNINNSEKKITSAGALNEKYPNRRFRITNLLEELDSPGEWYIDRVENVIYYYPEEEVWEAELGYMEKPLIQCVNASNVIFNGIEFLNTRTSALKAKNCNNVQIENCVFKNCSLWAAEITESEYVNFENNTIKDSGAGIYMSGGNTETLEGSNNNIIGNCIYNIGKYSAYGRNIPVSIVGVGINVKNNVIYDTPFHAINYKGNDHYIANNEIYNVCGETNDVSAIYSGRSFIERGTKICYNYIHDIEPEYNFNEDVEDIEEWPNGFKWVYGVYLDDALSGQSVFNNIIANTPAGINVNAGRDNSAYNNLFTQQTGNSIYVTNYASGDGRKQRQESEYRLISENAEYAKYKITTDNLGYPAHNTVNQNIVINGIVEIEAPNEENGGIFDNEMCTGSDATDVIVAFYDKNGQLLSSSIVDDSNKLNVPEQGIYRVKVFCWNMSNLQPADKGHSIAMNGLFNG